MNRTQLALTIKSRIPREITADRAVGAGAGARERDRDEQKTDSDRWQREREKGGGTAAVYRSTDKLQGAGLSAGRRGR